MRDSLFRAGPIPHFDPVLKTYLHQCRLMATDPDALMRLFGDAGVVVSVKRNTPGWEGIKTPFTPREVSARTKVVVIDKRNDDERVVHYLWKVGDKWVHACSVNGNEIPKTVLDSKYVPTLTRPFREIGTISDFPEHLYDPLVVQSMILDRVAVEPNMSHVLDLCKSVSGTCGDLIRNGLKMDHGETMQRYLSYDEGTYVYPPRDPPRDPYSTPQPTKATSKIPAAASAPARAMETSDVAHGAFRLFSTGEINVPWEFTEDIEVAVDDGGITTTVTNDTKRCAITVTGFPRWFPLIAFANVQIPDISGLEEDKFSANVDNLSDLHLSELRGITVTATITAVEAQSPQQSPGGGTPSPGGGTPSPGGGTPSPGGVVLQRVVLGWNGNEWQILANESDDGAVTQLLATSTIKDILRIQ